MVVSEAKSLIEKNRIFSQRFDVFYSEYNKILPGTDFKNKRIIQELDSNAVLVQFKIQNELAGSVRFVSLKDYPFDSFYNIKLDGLLEKYSRNEISNLSLLCMDKDFRNLNVLNKGIPLLYKIAKHYNSKINVILSPERCIPYYSRLGFKPFKNASHLTEYEEDMTIMTLDINSISDFDYSSSQERIGSLKLEQLLF